MITLTNLIFWLHFLYFLLVILLVFFLPGYFLLRKTFLNFFHKFVLSLIIGMSLWGWQGFIFGYLEIRWLTYVYLFAIIIFSLVLFSKQKLHLSLSKISFDHLTVLIILLVCIGTFTQLIMTFFVGIEYQDGIYFCCAVPDSIYHLSLTNQLIRQVPPIEPGASEIIVHNYHYISNLLVADLVRIFRLPLIATQYQYMTALFSLLLGLSAITFARVMKLPKGYIPWLLVFLYFSGDITYVVLFFLGKGLNLQLPFLHNAAWLWISPPRVFAIVMLFGSISLLYLWVTSKKLLPGIAFALITSILIGVKVYVGIFALIGIISLGSYFLFSKRYSNLPILIFTLILSTVIHLTVSKNAGGLIFSGLWRFQDFIVNPILGLSNLELIRQTYIAHNNLPRLAQYSLIFIAVYFISIFGTLLLGFIQAKKSLSLFQKEIHIFLIPSIFICIILGSFFAQQTGGANSSQFIITVHTMISIYAALACYYWTQNIKLPFRLVFVSFIMLLTIPRVMHLSYDQFNKLTTRQGFFISRDELVALHYLKEQTPPDSIILVDNIDKGHWQNANSHYIGFISNRQLFIDGYGITLDHGVQVKEKIETAEEIFTSTDHLYIQDLAQKNHIDYLYMLSSDYLPLETNELSVVFQNGSITILKVR